MILTTGMPADPATAMDGQCGQVVDLVVDPILWKVTHHVVEPSNRHARSRLVSLAGVTWTDQAVSLACSTTEVSACPPVEATDFVALELSYGPTKRFCGMPTQAASYRGLTIRISGSWGAWDSSERDPRSGR